MKVKDLIEYLKSLDPEMDVAYKIFSEQCLLDEGDIEIIEGCFPRPDGWIHDKRPDMPVKQYILFPGN